MSATEVIVIDSLMGTGKTSWAIQNMNDEFKARSQVHDQEEYFDIKRNYIYITPLLSEVQRIKDCTDPGLKFVEPKNHGKGKLDDFNHKMLDCNMVSTHELFKHIDGESQFNLFCNYYDLYLDECLDVIEPLKLNHWETKTLIEKEFVKIDETTHKANWIYGDNTYDGPLAWVKDYADSGQLLCVNNRFFIWEYDPDIFSGLFEHIYIMTYQFEKSILAKYFKLYNIDYKLKSVKFNNNTHKYELVDYYKPNLKPIRDLITVYDGPLNSNFVQTKESLTNRNLLSKSSTNKINFDAEQLKRNMSNLFKHVWNTTSDDFMWSSYKDFAKRICAKGFMYIDTDRYPNKTNKTFVPCNAKGTNEFSNKHYLVYACNLILHPAINDYFKVMSDGAVKMENDDYALNNMIQWIWRSAIRNGEHICIYVPSERMRKLLLDWLNS